MSVDIEVTKESVEVVSCLPSYPLDDHEFKESCFRMKKSLNVSYQERRELKWKLVINLCSSCGMLLGLSE